MTTSSQPRTHWGSAVQRSWGGSTAFFSRGLIRVSWAKAAFSGLRNHKTVSWPLRLSWQARAVPQAPAPMTAAFILFRPF